MKVYLDNDMVSGLGKRDFPTSEMMALSELMDLFLKGRLDLTTSKVTLRELGPYHGEHKQKIEKIYRALKKVPFVEDHKVLGFNFQWDRYTSISSPLVEDHPVSLELRKRGLDRTDAHHLTVAILAKCDLFLTCDRRIRNHTSQLKGRFSIEPIKPSTLIERLRLSDSPSDS